METNEETKPKNLYQKLLEIQKKINGLAKDKQAFGYKYVTGDKLLGFLKPIMNEVGVLLKQEVLSIENIRQDYTTKQGAKSEINSKVMMRFTWVDCDTGEKDENLFGANGQNDWDKGVGSALTYGERYFLLKFFHIATDEDDIDNPERKPEQARTETVSKLQAEIKASPEQIAKIEHYLSHALFTHSDSDPDNLKRLRKAYRDSTAPKAEKAIEWLAKELDRRERYYADEAA